MNKSHFMAIALIVLGMIYFVRPNLFRRGIWLKTSVAVRTLSPKGYIRYMRGLGIMLMIVGIVLFILGTTHPVP